METEMGVQNPSTSNRILTTVYAIHDFQAENPDELSFEIGELITVTEKDDQYGDGWWQGHNSKGAFGLFPKDYTSADPPSNTKPTMNDTLFQVQNAIDQLHNPSTSSALSLPAVLSSASQNSIQKTDYPEDDYDQSPIDQTTWDRNASAAQARAVLAEKAKANALAHQLVMDRLKSASEQLYPVPHSPSSSHVSIPELDEMDFSEESGDDLHQQVHRGHSRDDHQHSKAPTQPRSQKAIGAADIPLPSSIPPTPNQRINQTGLPSLRNPTSEDDHDPPSSLASGPFSAAALALGLTHTPASPAKPNPSSTCNTTQPSSRVQSIPLKPSHKPNQLSSSSILSDMSAFVNRDPRAASPPIASTLRMSRESSQFTHPHQLDHIRDQSHPHPTSGHALSPMENPLSNRAPSSQQDTSLTSPLNPTLSAPRNPEAQYPSKSFISPDSTKEHLASPTNLRPNSLEAVGSFHQRQRSASSADSGVFVRQQNTSPFHHHSPAPAIHTNTSTTISNVHTSNSTGDSSSARGSRSRSSSRLAAVGEDQLISPATSTFPSVSGKHQAAGPLSSLGGPPNGLVMKPGFSEPSEWTVTEVVEWGKIKNFDEFTISKFIEHEITGDILLEFDIHTLKEIDLIAFGRRVKVIKAIDELRKIDSKALPPTAASTSHYRDLSQLHMQSPTESRQSAHSSGHKRSESANHSIRGGVVPPPTRAAVTPDHTVAPSHRSMGSTDLQHDFSDHEAGGDSGKFVGGGGILRTARRKSSLTGLVHETKKHTGGLSFAGLGRKSEADSDSVHNVEAPGSASWQQHSKREIAIPETAEKDDELHDSFDTALSPNHDPVEPTNSNRKTGKRQHAHSKRPGTANSILSRNPFTSSSTANTTDPGEQVLIDPPSSPEIPTGARQNDTASNSVKSRTSFLGKVRGGRKPPPQLLATVPAGESSLVSPVALSAAAVAEQTGSHGKKSRFNFGHQGQVQHQIHAAYPNPISSPSAVMEKEGTPLGPGQDNGAVNLTVPKGSSNDGQKTRSALERIGTPDHVGWMKKKGEKYPTWKMRYFILKNANLYYLKSENEPRIKGLVKLAGYKVVMDDDVNPGRYGFKIIHDNGSTHAFSADDSKLLRDWMKAMMKATIDRDWLAPVISSCNIPTMPIGEAQKLFPPPRPPSPASRTRAQKARLASNQELLMHKDPSVLMDMQRIAAAQQQHRFSIMVDNNTPPTSPPQSLLRPTRSVHRKKPNSMIYSPPDSAGFKPNQQEELLLHWINSNLPKECPEAAHDFSSSIRSGLVIVRLIESLTKTESGLSDDAFEIHKAVDGDMFNEVDIYFNVFDYLQKQRIPLEGYALNDMISGDPFKNKEFLLRVYNHFNRIKNFVVAHI